MATVVIASRDKETVNRARRVMENTGLNPVAANSSFLALQLIGNTEVSLVIADTDIDSGKGVALCVQIRELFGFNAPTTLIMSDKCDRKTLANAMSAGAAGVVVKSDPIEKLISLIFTLTSKSSAGEDDRHHRTASKRPSRQTDLLTGLNVRSYFESRLDAEWAYACYNHTPLSIMMIAPDNCKKLRSMHGDDVVDQMLSKVARVIEGTLRSRDCAARFDKDTFAVVLAETSLPTAVKWAKEIAASLDGMEFGNLDCSLKVSFSIGLSGVLNALYMSPERILQRGTQRVNNAIAAGGKRIDDGQHQWAA